MDEKKSYQEIRSEIEKKYYEKYVKPFEEGQIKIEDLKKRLLDNPLEAVRDPHALQIPELMNRFRSITKKLELSMRSLLLANAGGAIITINTLPKIVNNKELLSISANSLSGFAWGLVLILIAYICIFVSDWTDFFKDLLKILEIKNWKIIDIDYSSPALFVAAISTLASLYMFVSSILSATNGINQLL